MRKIAIACGALGLILVLAAFLLPFWITPSYIARLQSNANTVRNYNGQVLTLVNPAALSSGNLAGAVITGVPETLRRQVTVQDTSGDTALVRDATTATTAQRTIGSISSNYAVDRTSLEATASHPSNWNITHATGLTFNWPLGAQQHNYTGWVPFTQTTVPLKYLRQQPQAGINTNVYQATIPATPVRNPQVLGALPRALPASLLPQIAKAGLIPASDLAELARAYPNATSSIPVSYVYSGTSTYWVAPPTGIVVNTHTTESQVGGIVLPSRQFLPVFPVLSDNYGYTSSTIQSAVNDAKNDSSTINTWGIGVPIAAGLVGFALLAAAALLWIRGRRHGVSGMEHRAGGPSLDPAHAGARPGAGPGDRADWQYQSRPGSGGTGATQHPPDRRLVSRPSAVLSLDRQRAHGQRHGGDMNDQNWNGRGPLAETAPPLPELTDRGTWQGLLDDLVVREKAHTREGDAIAAARRRLPMVEVDPSIPVTGERGQVPLLEVFDGRRQLIVYYHMWHTGKPAQDQCPGCTFCNGQVSEISYLHSRDVTFATFSEGPYQESSRYREFMGYAMPWYSVEPSKDALLAGRWFGMLVCYLRDRDRVFETYWATGRATEAMGSVYGLLDMTVYGRQETFEDSPPGWPQFWRNTGEQWLVNGRPTAAWPRLAAGRSDDLGVARS